MKHNLGSTCHDRRSRGIGLRPVPATLALVAGLLLATPVQAQWSWAVMANGNWDNTINWEPHTVPDGPGADVMIGFPVTVHIDPLFDYWFDGATVHTLTMGAGSELRVTGPARLNVWGDLANDGEVVLTAINLDVGGGAGYIWIGQGGITGSGVIRMVDNFNLNYDPTIWGGSMLHGAEHTIRGVGRISNPLVNEGLIRADPNGSPDGDMTELILWTSDKSNMGTMQAVDGGILRIHGITVDNTGGLIEANGAGAIVRLAGGTVRGGQLATADGGLIEINGNSISTLDTPTIAGDLVARFGNQLAVEGATWVQDGTTVLEHASMVIRDPATTASGGGEIVITQGDIGLASLVGEEPENVLAIADDFAVRGGGEVVVRIDNHGQVIADDPAVPLRLTTHPASNAGVMQVVNDASLVVFVAVENSGTIEAVNGTVRFQSHPTIDQGATGSLIAGPDGEFRNGGRIVGGTIDVSAWTFSGPESLELEGVTNLGSLELPVTLTVRGAITNDGAIVVLDPGGFNANRMYYDDGATLGGSGELVIGQDFYCSVQPAAPLATLTNGAGHTIAGAGKIGGTIVNAGVLSPGDLAHTGSDIGRLRLLDGTTVTCTSTAEVRLQIANGTLDRIEVNEGSVSFACAGTLVVQHVGGFADPACGSTFDLIQTGPGGVTGAFDTLVLPALSGSCEYTVRYLGDRVRLVVNGGPADLDDDGAVGFSDLLSLLSSWGSCAGPCIADLDHDGAVGFSDLLLLLASWG